MKILSVGKNAKSEKSDKLFSSTRSAIVYLAPANLSGKNLCPHASIGCANACLYSAGRGRFERVQKARLERSYFFLTDRKNFLRQLIGEIAAFEYSCKKDVVLPVVRLNGTSDINYSRMKLESGKTIFEAFPDVQFYDYTKSTLRVINNRFENYHLTFSRDETNEQKAFNLIEMGFNVAFVFNAKTIPTTYKGFEVIDGDTHDLRFLDKDGCIVGLKAKGDAKKDKSGFVITI